MLKRLPLLVLLIASPCVAQTGTDARMHALQELMELTKARETTQSVMDEVMDRQMQMMADGLRPSMLEGGWSSENIDRFFDLMWQEMRRELADFPDMAVKFSQDEWARAFTHEEVVALIEFYKTPLGDKLVRLSPEIALRAAIYGEQIGAEKGRRAAEAALRRMNIR